MMYTSGTTGNPKGVIYSHRSIVLHTMATMFADSMGVRESDVILPVVPMFHANAWGLAHAGVATGATLVMPGRDLSPKAIADLMESERVTLAAGVPTIWMAVLPELEGRDVSSLRVIPCGGSAVPKALSEGFRTKVGLPILQAWGMTETSPLVSVLQHQEHAATIAADAELADLRTSVGLAMFPHRVPHRRARDTQPPAVGRDEPRRAASSGTVGRPQLLQRRAHPRLVHRGRLAAHRRRRGRERRGLHLTRRPHQGRHQVGRRMGQFGRARERDHGASVGQRSSRHRRALIRGGASGRSRASWSKMARR